MMNSDILQTIEDQLDSNIDIIRQHVSRAEALRIYVQHIRLGEVDSDLIGKYAAAAERFPTELRAAERELFDGPLGYSVKKHLHAVLPRTRELVRKEGA